MSDITSFSQLYDTPPLTHLPLPPDTDGSTSEFHPANPPPAYFVQQYIVEDRRIGPDALAFTRTYLSSVTKRPSDKILFEHGELEDMVHDYVCADKFSVGEILIFVRGYCSRFAKEAGSLPRGSIKFLSCPSRYWIKLDRLITRDGQNRVVLNS
ncbi:hypothetical protein AJ79_03891 [Helicocarpus griseus UAMH5409]|uniref:Uncharacterized protein n=1 Tax=Helicocarpus griseus UAMH5409 TaxID=1447875 RepID=A0A2B7XMQ2_9EURO|nr:hypothetical protein AJ79_03891 [Helicocarpus griseus UAMH5409]